MFFMKANRFEVYYICSIVLIFLYATVVNVIAHNDFTFVLYAAFSLLIMLIATYFSSALLDKVPYLPREICSLYFGSVLLAISGVQWPILLAIIIALLASYSAMVQFKKYQQTATSTNAITANTADTASKPTEKNVAIITVLIAAIITVSALAFMATFPLLDVFNRNSTLYPDKVHSNVSDKKVSADIIRFSYGSGVDKHRDAYGEGAALLTKPYDGSAMLSAWTGFAGWYRSFYWGLTKSTLPLNARVWQPEFVKPLPVVLIVHGDHAMQDFSDEGYDYLATHLAQQGYFVASIDENFLNRAWSDLLLTQTLMGQGEMKTRAQLLVEHLKQLLIWNNDKTSPLYQKLDLNNVGLIGHSRGGEAVSHVPKLLQSAGIEEIKIKSIIAIAPVFNNYRPNKQMNTIENTHYLVVHGSLDREVFFDGRGQYTRAAIHKKNQDQTSLEQSYLKLAGYIKGANHGQFNRVWGNCDHKFYSAFCSKINKKNLLPQPVQQDIAKGLFTRFFALTVNNEKPITPTKAIDFIDSIAPLAQITPIKWQHQTSAMKMWFDFEQAKQTKGISTDNLVTSQIKKITRGAVGHYLAWSQQPKSNLMANQASNAAWVKYKVPKPTANAALLSIDIANLLAVETDFTVQVEFSHGSKQIFTLAEQKKLAPAFISQRMTIDYLLGISASEAAFNTYTFALTRAEKVESVTLIFDRNTAGSIVIDNIGVY